MKLWTLLAIVSWTLVGPGCAAPAEHPQKMFASPDDAAQSLVDAVRANDQAHIKQILGPHSDDVTSSGDEVADLQADKKFIAAYDKEHHLVTADNGSVTLNTGDSDWPFPIPIVRDAKSGKWMFDTDAGKEEILNRRIGHNEREVILVCQAIIDAEREYAQRDPNADRLPEYTARFISDPGTKNGLYWPTDNGEPPSPLGAIVARAIEQGYISSGSAAGAAEPYHGYYYRILTSQGPHAEGGAYDYIIDRKMIGGVAVIAWPARYGNSGVMTFMVNHHEVVYQTDLGADTEKIANTSTAFDPGPNWTKVE